MQLIEGTDFSKYGDKSKLDRRISLDAIFKFAKDQNFGPFPHRVVRAWKTSSKNPNKPTPPQPIPKTPENEDGHFGQETIEAFDSKPISGIAELFSSITQYDTDKWKDLAQRAKRNGLASARIETSKGSGESFFNPVLVANWLISKEGISAERLKRKLQNNLPERSHDRKEDIFGIE